MDMSQYKSLFLAEAREYLKSINETVAALEESPSDKTAIDALFRGAHSLKGMAASMEYQDIVDLSHDMESLMIRVRDHEIAFDAAIAELLLEGAELIEGLIRDVELELEPRRPPGDLSRRLTEYQPGPAPQAAPGSQQEEPAPSDRQTAGQFQAGISAETAAAGQADGRERPGRETTGESSSVRVKSQVLDRLVNLTGELIANKNRLLNIGREQASPQLNQALSETGKLLRALHDEVMQVRLMPFEAICGNLQRSVRTLAKRSGKEVSFQLAGREIGLDRGILEQLTDPLNHLLRNALDHGLESAAERAATGKPSKGAIRLSVCRDRDRVVITVADDGRGIDPQLMVEAALGKGLIAAEEAEGMTERQALMLICLPGFSTARQVTELSGRGVGMDAVSACIQKLGGTLGIDSEPGKGSSFTLRLPATIAIIHALVVQCGALKVAVPVSAVQRSVELRKDQVERAGKRRVFHMQDEAIPLLSLNRMLGQPLARLRGGFMSLFVSEVNGRRVGLVVDRLLGQQELFVKPLGRPLGKLAGVAGAATLGDGEIVAILEIAELAQRHPDPDGR
jgi:two-component system chemotaxis sensor kinase CheA